MKFNIKDVKSWSNRHDVKAGDKGYFSNSINQLQNDIHLLLTTVDCIADDTGYCFVPKDYGDGFDFFLSVDAVKEDKPKEKRYRPFKTIDELEDTINKGNRSTYRFMRIGSDIFIKNINKNHITHLSITRIDRDAETNEVLFINGMSPMTLLKNYEISVGAEWVPFGVEVENDE